MIGAEGEMFRYGAASTLNAESAFLERPLDAGWRTASDWLDELRGKSANQAIRVPRPMFGECLEPAHLDPGAWQKEPPR